MDQYLPIFTMLVLAILFSGLSFFASGLLAPKKASTAKEAPYECGIVPTREPAERFPVRFYVVAMLFIIFDIEIIFLFPWAVRFRELGLFGLVEMAVFIALVFVAYAYVWRAGGLDWAETVATPLEADPGEPDLMAQADADLAAAMRDPEAAGAR